MILLGIDTSISLSIALYKNHTLLEEINETKPHVASEKCSVLVEELLHKHSIDTIDYIALNIGPGSYTGLRVSLSFAKGLAFGKETKLIAVNSMESLLRDTSNHVAILESKRDEVYTSTDGKVINTFLKNDLSKQFDSTTSFITASCKDFKTYLPEATFSEKALSAQTICEIAQEKIFKEEFISNADLDVIYIKPFAS